MTIMIMALLASMSQPQLHQQEQYVKCQMAEFTVNNFRANESASDKVAFNTLEQSAYEQAVLMVKGNAKDIRFMTARNQGITWGSDILFGDYLVEMPKMLDTCSKVYEAVLTGESAS